MPRPKGRQTTTSCHHSSRRRIETSALAPTRTTRKARSATPPTKRRLVRVALFGVRGGATPLCRMDAETATGREQIRLGRSRHNILGYTLFLNRNGFEDHPECTQ